MPVNRSGFNLTWKLAKKNFFRTEPVDKAYERASYRVARRVGGATRKYAMASMRRGRRYSSKKQLPAYLLKIHNDARRAWHRSGHAYAEPQLPRRASRPGEPPKVVSGLLKRNIQFSYVREGISYGAIIGPVKLSGSDQGDNWTAVPRLMEYGGMMWSKYSQSKRVRLHARPYMRPALAVITQPSKVSQYWTDAMKP